MKYAKKYRFGGVDSTLTACVEVQGKPTTTTEGEVGLLTIDVSSPTHEVYKCVAVNGAIYTWELLSSGMSILSSSEAGGGKNTAIFTYESINKTNDYVVKVGDLILDSRGYLYSITALGNTSCDAKYTNIFLNRDGVGISNVEQKSVTDKTGVITNEITLTLTNGNNHTFTTSNGENAYQLAVKKGYEGTEEEWLEHLGYETWLKGKAVTQDEYDALSDDEKYKSGFMYVIKDAEINTNTADTAKSLELSRVFSDTHYGSVATQVRASIPQGVYMIEVRYGSVPVVTEGLFSVNDNVTDRRSNYYVDGDNVYYCAMNYIVSVEKWEFKLIKSTRQSDGTYSNERTEGTINLYKIK